MHVDGKPNENKHLLNLVNAKNFITKAFFRWGDWNSGGSCDSNVPLSGRTEVVQDGSSDPTADGALTHTKIKILDITAIS